MKAPSVAIIGGGPAGLAAGLASVRSGYPTVLLEKTAQWGGIASTISHGKYLFDIGGHRYLTRSSVVNDLWRQVLGDEMLRVSRRSSIYYRGKYIKYPLEVSGALLALGVPEALRVVASYLRAQMGPATRTETLQQWITSRFGTRLYDKFFAGYTQKVWGLPGNEISAEWADERIEGLTLSAALAHAVRGRRASRSLANEFMYPSRGAGMMWERFAQIITAEGGTVRTGADVARLQTGGGRVLALAVRSGKNQEAHSVDEVISSMPITELVRRLHPPAPAHVRDAAARLRYRSLVVVGLVLRIQRCFREQWVYVQSPELKVGRIQNFKNWSPAMVPDPQTTSLGFEYFCSERDEIWSLGDGELTDLAAREMEELGLAHRTDVLDSVVIRQRNAYPVYDSGHAERVRVVRDYLDRLTNLQTIGRNGLHRYDNMDSAMLTGLQAVQRVSGRWGSLPDASENGAASRTRARAQGL